MVLTMVLADVVMMDLVVNSLGYVVGIGFIVFLLVVILKSMARDRRYEAQLEGFNELYEKSKNEPKKSDQTLQQ